MNLRNLSKHFYFLYEMFYQIKNHMDLYEKKIHGHFECACIMLQNNNVYEFREER